MDGNGRVIAIIGASNDRRKFGNRAVRAFARQGYVVRPVHPTESDIEGIAAYRTLEDVPEPVDIISLYVPAETGITLLDAIAARRPAEFWVNPGAESADLVARARALGLEPILACSMDAMREAPV